MSQFELVVDPANDTGTDLSVKLNAWREAIHSGHLGNSRPIYAIAGTMWVDNSTPDNLKLYFYDGNQDILMCYFNTGDSSLGFSGANAVSVAPTPPTNARVGDLWFESDTGSLYVQYQNSVDMSKMWVATAGSMVKANSVSCTATPPLGAKEGDMWFEADTGNLYVYYQNPTNYEMAWVSAGATANSPNSLGRSEQKWAVKADFLPDTVYTNTHPYPVSINVYSGGSSATSGLLELFVDGLKVQQQQGEFVTCSAIVPTGQTYEAKVTDLTNITCAVLS